MSKSQENINLPIPAPPKNDVQLYMCIYDIKPTESFWDTVDDTKLYTHDAKLWTKEELIDDIRANGIKYQLNIDPEGNVKNGNMRYWCARYLLEKENDQRFLYLPVQRNYAAGAFYQEFQLRAPKNVSQQQIDKIADELALSIHRQWVNQTRELTIKSNTNFPITKIDPIDEFRLQHFWDVQRNVWALFIQPHPRHKNNTMCFGIPGRSGRTDVMEHGSKQEKKAFKKWWKKKREERMIIGSQTSLTKPKLHGKIKTQ